MVQWEVFPPSILAFHWIPPKWFNSYSLNFEFHKKIYLQRFTPSIQVRFWGKHIYNFIKNLFIKIYIFHPCSIMRGNTYASLWVFVCVDSRPWSLGFGIPHLHPIAAYWWTFKYRPNKLNIFTHVKTINPLSSIPRKISLSVIIIIKEILIR